MEAARQRWKSGTLCRRVLVAATAVHGAATEYAAAGQLVTTRNAQRNVNRHDTIAAVHRDWCETWDGHKGKGRGREAVDL